MEFEFDFPFEVSEDEVLTQMKGKQITYSQASVQLYEKNWKWKRRELQLESRCLSAMIERLFPKKKLSFWKILVELVEKTHYSAPRNVMGVIAIEQKFDFEWYNTQAEQQKLIFLFECAKNAVNIISYEFPEILVPFNQVFIQIQQNNLNNNWYWKHGIRNPSKNLFADVFIEHLPKHVMCSAYIHNCHGETICTIPLFSALPDERAYAQYLGKFVWVNDSTISLIGKRGDVVKTIEIVQNM